jgi:hypothetical protein
MKISADKFKRMIENFVGDMDDPAEGSSFDVYSAIEASYEAGYEDIKNKIKPKEGYDFDFQSLYDEGVFLWETEMMGDLSFALNKGINVWTVTCRDEYGNYGKLSSYDKDSWSLAFLAMGTLKEVIKEKEAL